MRVSCGDLCEAEAPTEPSGEKRVSGGDLCEAKALTEPSGEKRVSGGDLCEAEAPTEPSGESRALLPLPRKILVNSRFARIFSYPENRFSNSFSNKILKLL